jgi:hypothetical protein
MPMVGELIKVVIVPVMGVVMAVLLPCQFGLAIHA